MSRTNDELYADLLDEWRDLTARHVLGQSRERQARLHEVCYLIQAYKRGEQIVYAKLAYDPADFVFYPAGVYGIHLQSRPFFPARKR